MLYICFQINQSKKFVMSKKTVTVDFYLRQAEKMIALGKRIEEKSAELGDESQGRRIKIMNN